MRSDSGVACGQQAADFGIPSTGRTMELRMTSTGVSPSDDLQQMVGAYEISRMLHIIAAIGITDLLVDGHKDVAELTVATRMHALTLYRLLRALAAVVVVAGDTS